MTDRIPHHWPGGRPAKCPWCDGTGPIGFRKDFGVKCGNVWHADVVVPIVVTDTSIPAVDPRLATVTDIIRREVARFETGGGRFYAGDYPADVARRILTALDGTEV